MRSMWTKIGFGAVGVFLLGMLLLTGFRRSRDAVAQAVAGSFVPALHAAANLAASAHPDLPFRLDGHRLGSVTRMRLERTNRNRLLSVQLDVSLNEGTDAAELADCELQPLDDHDVNFDHGFRCGDPKDAGLVQIGEARFEPIGLIRPVKIRRGQLGQLSTGEPFKANLDMAHGVQVAAKGRDKGSVRVRADSTGAMLLVNDKKGGDLVRISADSTHAFIQIRGTNGKVVFRLQAGDSGLSLAADAP